MYVSAKVQILYNFDLFLHNEQQSFGTLSWVGSAYEQTLRSSCELLSQKILNDSGIEPYLVISWTLPEFPDHSMNLSWIICESFLNLHLTFPKPSLNLP